MFRCPETLVQLRDLAVVLCPEPFEGGRPVVPHTLDLLGVPRVLQLRCRRTFIANPLQFLDMPCALALCGSRRRVAELVEVGIVLGS